jgi:hypothetical protein
MPRRQQLVDRCVIVDRSSQQVLCHCKYERLTNTQPALGKLGLINALTQTLLVEVTELQAEVYEHLFFNFRLWSKADFQVQQQFLNILTRLIAQKPQVLQQL